MKKKRARVGMKRGRGVNRNERDHERQQNKKRKNQTRGGLVTRDERGDSRLDDTPDAIELGDGYFLRI